jgi:hypothetical protein
VRIAGELLVVAGCEEGLRNERQASGVVGRAAVARDETGGSQVNKLTSLLRLGYISSRELATPGDGGVEQIYLHYDIYNAKYWFYVLVFFYGNRLSHHT